MTLISKRLGWGKTIGLFCITRIFLYQRNYEVPLQAKILIKNVYKFFKLDF